MWRPVTEDELQLYVDGRLSRPREAAVEAHLDANPDDAARIEAYGLLNHMMQELGNAIDAELPRAGAARLHGVLAEHAARERRRRRDGTIAAMFVLAAALSVAGVEAFHAKGGPTLVERAAVAPASTYPAHAVPVSADRRAP
jgi:anti-sigma factor RsiW